MRGLLGKAAFVHRRLWLRDGTYRLAFLAGPAPLAGLAAATALWFGLHGTEGAIPGGSAGTIPWARYTPPVTSPSAAPIAAIPNAPLPAVDARGGLSGLTTGWRVRLFPMTVDAAFSIDIKPISTAALVTGDPTITLDRIIAGGPPDALFLGAETAYLVIRKAGVYGLTIKAQRASDQSANCLERFSVANRRLVANLRVNVSGSFAHVYDPVRFEMTSGLYWMAVGFSCWRGQHMAGPGRVTVMIRHPGDPGLTPVTAAEVQRPLSSE